MKTILMVLALMSVCFASFNLKPSESAEAVLFSARQADMMEYYVRTGVVLKDEPMISPYFACLRSYIWSSYQVDNALMVDRVSCLPYSHYRNAWRGLEMCIAGNSNGRHLINSNILEAIDFDC